MAKKFESIEEIEQFIQNLKDYGFAIPPDVLVQREELKNQREELKNQLKDDEFIYNTLKEHTKYPPYPEEKDRCVRKTVEKLLEDGPNATDPVLLLGKIQCGKTDTFENIIGLCFDRGIDVCVIFTKGTQALAKQTKERFANDYDCFKDKGRIDQKAIVHTFDIMEDFSHDGLPESIFNRAGTKVAIICKKQADNMKHLINLFTKKSPYLQDMKVLVCDDEADFASRNYVKKDGNTDLAVISKQIVEFTKIPKYCRYLQVTATPYSLYLQPDGTIQLGEGGEAIPTFKPRYTALVPVHAAYVGGKQYFEDSTNPESMFSNLYHTVSEKCVEVMGKRDKRYEKNGIASKNIQDLTYGIVSYVMAAAIRSIQEERAGNIYKSSALIHVDIDKDSHTWQETLVKRIVQQVGDEILNATITDERVREYVRTLYPDFQDSHDKAVACGMKVPELPTGREVMMRMRQLYAQKEITVQVVNSDNDIQSKLSDDGQLKLTSACNIFIGGSILDRGITINNMLCFFYGRDPKKFQMDTVLQHCRMYGPRSMADMAVTRFHTTEKIYRAFVTMNRLDNQLREWFVKHNDDVHSEGDFNAVFVGYGKSIKPCAAGKIRISNNVSISAGQRILPVGFQTGPQSSIAKTVEKIEQMIESSPYYNIKDEDGFFEIPVDTVKAIIPLIRSTYVYGPEKNNMNEGLDWDENEMLGTMQYAVEQADTDTIWCIHRKTKNMSRYRGDGIRFIDAPDDGHKDTGPSRRKAIDKPVVMFLKEAGGVEQGWRGTPFYWPVFVVQQNIDDVIFTLGVSTEDDKERVDASELLKGIDPSEVLKLTICSVPFWEFINGTKTVEYRDLKTTTASRFLVRDYSTQSGYKIRTDVDVKQEDVFNVNASNGGVFPFVFRPYKYVLFRNSRDMSGSVLLMKIDESNPITTSTSELNDVDRLIDRHGTETKFKDSTRLTQWLLDINMEKVVGFKLNQRDQMIYDEMKAQN